MSVQSTWYEKVITEYMLHVLWTNKQPAHKILRLFMQEDVAALS